MPGMALREAVNRGLLLTISTFLVNSSGVSRPAEAKKVCGTLDEDPMRRAWLSPAFEYSYPLLAGNRFPQWHWHCKLDGGFR